MNYLSVAFPKAGVQCLSTKSITRRRAKSETEDLTNPLPSKKRDIPLEAGKKIAEEFIAFTCDFYDRIEIGGSIRRKVPLIHDIDLCAIAKEPISRYSKVVKDAGGHMIRFGGEYATLLFRGVQINVLFTTPETWGASLMWSTGPKGHTIGMNIKADQMGLKFKRTGIRNRSDDSLIPSPTEQDIAKLLHWDYKPPELRGLGQKERFDLF